MWKRITLCAFTSGGILLSSNANAFSSMEKSTATPDRIHDNTNGDTLKLVQVVFRHGARTPLSMNYWPSLVESWDVCGEVFTPIPVEIFNEDGGGPRPVNAHDAAQVATKLPGGMCSKGELTKEGQRQARAFGRWLRQRYVAELGYLPEEYVPGVVYSRTTNYSRTIATLRGVLTGLFPETQSKVPVHTTEEQDEILFGNQESCRRLKSIIKATASGIDPSLMTEEGRNLQERIREILNLAPTEPVRFLDLHDAITTMHTHGKKENIPSALRDPELLKEIENRATRRFMRFIVGEMDPNTGKPSEILRLGMGRLMHLMMEKMSATSTTTDQTATKLYLYSGHDSTILPLLVALGQEIDHWPVYLSNIIFELWQKPNNGEHYVRVLYNTEPLDMEPTCGTSNCSLESLKEHVLGPYLISHKERESECLLHFSHDQPAGEHVTEVDVGSSVADE